MCSNLDCEKSVCDNCKQKNIVLPRKDGTFIALKKVINKPFNTHKVVGIFTTEEEAEKAE